MEGLHVALSRASTTVVALAVGVFALASCSSAADGSAGSDEEQIKQVTQDYITAVNSGKMTDVPALVCSRVVPTIPGGGEDLPESARKAQIDGFETITVTGGSATARVTVSVIGDDSTAPEIADMVFVDEDGWKLCQ